MSKRVNKKQLIRKLEKRKQHLESSTTKESKYRSREITYIINYINTLK